VSDGRTPRLLVPDSTPLSLLAMLGKEALGWLFVPGSELWVTDMVRNEALREPDPGDDPRTGQRRVLRAWFEENASRIRIQPTPEGRDYEREMRNWVRGGRPPADKPSWRNRGERSVADVLSAAAEVVADGEAVILLVDDRSARAMLVRAVQSRELEADIMATETFLVFLEEDFGVVEAGTAWQAIRLAAGGDEPATPVADPVYVRKR
jgi:hypothetical protein